jgi:hypothetical protein
LQQQGPIDYLIAASTALGEVGGVLVILKFSGQPEFGYSSESKARWVDW